MQRYRRYHGVFALALLALVALGAWWTVYIARSVEVERECRLAELAHAAQVSAIVLGHQQREPTLQVTSGAVALELLPTDRCQPGDLSAQAVPFHPEVSIRPAPMLMHEVEDRLVRRRAMVIGEGGFLFLLLGVITVMLYRSVRQERRHLRRMEDFVSAVTHEMKTPLAGMKSLLQTLAAGRVPDDQQPRLLTMGLKEAERLEHTIENVLISGSLRTDRFRVHVEQTDLHQHLVDFLDHRRKTLVDRPDAIQLAWEAGDEPVHVAADPHALRVILENLVDNALKYGGPDPTVTLRVQVDGRAVVRVEDQGIGFEPAEVEDLFLPFNRASHSENRVRHGTGLGLRIAQLLAHRMGGEVTGHSDGPGHGSVFAVSVELWREAR